MFHVEDTTLMYSQILRAKIILEKYMAVIKES